MSQKKTGGKISLWKRFFLQSYSSAIVAIILLIFIFSVFTDAFLTPFNLFNLSRTAAVYAFIGASQLILMVIGDMNLGIGACGALSTVVMGTLITKFGLPILPAVLMAVLVSVLCGLMIGLLVVKMKLNPWIITLANSISITPGIAHTFGPKPGMGDLICGEVSKVNDDNIDNYHIEFQPQQYPEIEEDEPIFRPLCNEYDRVL